ncbi:MAG TPA: acyl-CoA thioester hydrolase/BAAT C-terminal domain-containing protein [Anaerolineales bacterium]
MKAVAVAVLLSGCGARTAPPAASPATTAAIAATSSSSALTVTPGPPTATPPPYQDLVHLFDYEQSAPLDIHEQGVVDYRDTPMHDISYAGADGSRVTAYLVVPSGKGPFAAILFLHGGGGDRHDFQFAAANLAKLGAVGLLVDGPVADTGTESDHAQIIRLIINLRRGIDLLAARPDVDPQRIGYVGFSNGADLGGVLAGVDKRIKAYVLQSGDSRHSQQVLAMGNKSFYTLMAPLDGINYIGHAAPAALFFQFGLKDYLVPDNRKTEFYQAASEPKAVKYYAADHGLNFSAYTDYVDWLTAQLSLKASP